MNTITEKDAVKVSGFIAVLAGLILVGIDSLLFRNMTASQNWSLLAIAVLILLVILLLTAGFIIVQPNESKVLVFFGRYTGTVRESGFWCVNPFTVKKNVSLRIHNFSSDKIKVNDLLGNPIEIAAVIVWRVVDSAKALFDVENYQQFTNIQCETAIRALATQYPYDVHEEDKPSLRGSQTEVAENLRGQVQARLTIAGIEISEARISHLAYAPEIAGVMLRRQQAEAIIAARSRIVEGAVGMVEHALKMLGEKHIVSLDDEKKAAMTNNLLVALISEHEVTPIVNSGTLYS